MPAIHFDDMPFICSDREGFVCRDVQEISGECVTLIQFTEQQQCFRAGIGLIAFPSVHGFFGDCDIVQVIQLYNYVMDRQPRFFRIVFKAAPICIFFMLVLLLNLSLAVLYWKKLDKSILVYGKTGQQEILGI